MVFPPNVVSKAKSSFSLMARSSRRLPSCQAALLASSCEIPGFASTLMRVISASSPMKCPPYQVSPNHSTMNICMFEKNTSRYLSSNQK